MTVYLGEAGDKVRQWNEITARKCEKDRGKRRRTSAAPGSFDAWPRWRQAVALVGAAVVFWAAVGACLSAADVLVGILSYGAWGAWENGYLPFYALVVALLFIDWRWCTWRQTRADRDARIKADTQLEMWRAEHNRLLEINERDPHFRDLYDDAKD